MKTQQLGQVLGISKQRNWWNRQSCRRITEGQARESIRRSEQRFESETVQAPILSDTGNRPNARQMRRLRRALKGRDIDRPILRPSRPTTFNINLRKLSS